MITNKINCTLSAANIQLLREIKNCDIRISTEPIDGKTTIIILESNEVALCITNEPYEQMDGDEYPVLTVSTDENFISKGSFTLDKAKVLQVYLIRDTFSWIRDDAKWEVQIDIGMKIVTDKKEVLFLAMDSVGGLMTFVYGKDIILKDSEYELKEHWIFKSDIFIDLKREQIPIMQ
jgi:hypothetical protein